MTDQTQLQDSEHIFLITMLSHPLCSTPHTRLHLPRFPSHTALTQQPTTYQGFRSTILSFTAFTQQSTTRHSFSVSHSVAYSYLHHSLRPVTISIQHVQTVQIPKCPAPKQLASPYTTVHSPVVRLSVRLSCRDPTTTLPHCILTFATPFLTWAIYTTLEQKLFWTSHVLKETDPNSFQTHGLQELFL